MDYVICYDGDDEPTLDVILDLDKRLGSKGAVGTIKGDRPLSLGELHNAMAASCNPKSTFMLWSDRLVSAAVGWDHAIAQAVMQLPHRVIWLDSVHLEGACQFILPPMYRAALPSAPCPALFPFWFEDSHVEEVDAFVHGFPRVSLGKLCAGPRTERTNRMRDLPFWIDLYMALMPDRIAEAEKTAAKLGIAPRKDLPALRAHFDARMLDMRRRAGKLTEQYGDLSEPDDSYLQAKASALAMLAERRELVG